MNEEDDDLMEQSEDAMLEQFMSEVVSSASNLQTLSFSIDSLFEFEFEGANIAPFFPQLARLRALELIEGPGTPYRCFHAAYIAACHESLTNPERCAPCRTEWFNLFSHLTGLTKLSYERCEPDQFQDVDEVPTEYCDSLFAALSKLAMLQELTMVNMNFWLGGIAEMPEEIGSLHQLR